MPPKHRNRSSAASIKVVVSVLVFATCLSALYVSLLELERFRSVSRIYTGPKLLNENRTVLSRLRIKFDHNVQVGQYRDLPHREVETSLRLDPKKHGSRRRCSKMSDCFDFSRCSSNSFSIYVYHKDLFEKISPVYQNVLNAISSSPYYSLTNDPQSACMFVLSLDTIDRDKLSKSFVTEIEKKVSGLPFWNDGQNHIIFNLFSGTWPYYHENLAFNFGKAILAKASISTEVLRTNFDISIPLFPVGFPLKRSPSNTGDESGNVRRHNNIFPVRRKYLLAFKGKRYLTGIGSETRNSLHLISNHEDILLLTTCRHGKDWQKYQDERCLDDNAKYDQ